MKVNLYNELINTKARKIEKARVNLIKNDIDKLLENVEKDYIFNGLKGMGFTEKVQVIQEYSRSPAFSNLDQSRIFSHKEIKEICIKYRLRCLPTHYYKGTIDNQTIIEKEKFENVFGQKLDNGQFFIVAPESSFSLQKRPKDPLLFYRLDINTFYLIHKWGTDLSWFRKIAMYFVRTGYHFGGLLGLMVVALGTIACFSSNFFISGTLWFFSIVALLATITCLSCAKEGSIGFTSDSKWSDEYH